jgi:hypothetical protein
VIPTAISFSLSKHTGGGDTAPAFSGQHVYLQFMWEVGLLPSPVEISSDCHFYKLSCSCLLLGVCCRSCLLWPACCEVFLLPPSSVLRAPHCPGGYADLAQGCLWEYHMPLSSPCGLCLLKQPGHWCLAVVLESSWFLHLM